MIIVWLISSGWSSAAADTAINTMTVNVANGMELAAKTFKVDRPYKYSKYASAPQAPGIFKSYGEKNMRRLIDVEKSVEEVHEAHMIAPEKGDFESQ